MGSSALMINLINSSTILYSAVSVAPGTVYPDIPTFSVVGYKFLDDNSETNPILNSATESTTFNTTGWFLILKNTTANGFDVSSLIQAGLTFGKSSAWLRYIIKKLLLFRRCTTKLEILIPYKTTPTLEIAPHLLRCQFAV
jgi:hypothetical protein